MFNLFSYNKIQYEKGQIFPFLIAILCVVIILMMITVNIGQIGVFKTDVSNAADAGALAAASTISQTLLSLGLKSDSMSGYGLITIVSMIRQIAKVKTFPNNLITAYAIVLSHLHYQNTEKYYAIQEAQMGWSNAKRTALQYAFQNVGVDEPRPTFKQFLTAMGQDPQNPADPLDYYDLYIKGEGFPGSGNAVLNAQLRERARNGFAWFMENSDPTTGGYWHFGDIGPGITSPINITSGYGWENDEYDTALGKRHSSYHDPALGKSDYYDYDNWVDVQVECADRYNSIKLFRPLWILAVAAGVAVLTALLCYPEALKWCSWAGIFAPILAAIMAVMMGAFGGYLVSRMSMGLTMDHGGEVDDNYINVMTRRYKRPADLVMWNFQYRTVQAVSVGRAFREETSGDDATTIEPTFFDGAEGIMGVIFILTFIPLGIAYFITEADEIWDTEIHLFESELTYAGS